ncbi:hypothetical protein IGI04_003135 [Brassica rapa subsp. trilocularis]|uniref:FBD domain-containing protein n=1 Tax=Brassica rapa subsp. trilocularis TaxID=1813537 RepID=A0ABQ7NXJ5_BRACM|nr:hypothetical protein IGI04_003135 [Brassica rapa subsp. trilocularis]
MHVRLRFLRSGQKVPDNRLPPMLFATDRCLCGRLNIYSKPDLLAFIRHALPGTRSLRLSKLLVLGSCLTYELASVLSRAN